MYRNKVKEKKMKTAVIYYSEHHGNTKKLLDAVKSASQDEIKLFNILETAPEDLSQYDMIGYASGIYYSKFHKKLLAYAEKNTPENMEVFFIYTYGAEKDGYTKAIRQAVATKNAKVLGEFGSFGFNTFGPFKLIGGIAKNRPNDTDLKNAVDFYNGLHS